MLLSMMKNMLEILRAPKIQNQFSKVGDIDFIMSVLNSDNREVQDNVTESAGRKSDRKRYVLFLMFKIVGGKYEN